MCIPSDSIYPRTQSKKRGRLNGAFDIVVGPHGVMTYSAIQAADMLHMFFAGTCVKLSNLYRRVKNRTNVFICLQIAHSSEVTSQLTTINNRIGNVMFISK